MVANWLPSLLYYVFRSHERQYWIVNVALNELDKNYFNFSMCVNVQYENNDPKASKFAFKETIQMAQHSLFWTYCDIYRYSLQSFFHDSRYFLLLLCFASFFDTFLHVSNTRVYGFAGADNTYVVILVPFLWSFISYNIIWPYLSRSASFFRFDLYFYRFMQIHVLYFLFHFTFLYLKFQSFVWLYGYSDSSFSVPTKWTEFSNDQIVCSYALRNKSQRGTRKSEIHFNVTK